MKKIICSVFAIFFSLCCLFISGCVFHDHKFEEEWSFDSTYHWHESTCGHSVKKDLQRHTFDSENRCEVCGYHNAEEYTKGLNFELDRANKVYVVKDVGSATSTKIVIPSEYNGYPVAKIGERAFSGFKVSVIIIPDTIEEIGEYAFYNCSSLADMILPASVRRIGHDAFAGCTNLKEIIFGGVDGWNVGEEFISASDLADAKRAAELLKEKTDEWIRSI